MTLLITIPSKIAHYAASKAVWKVARKSDSFADAEKKADEALESNLRTYMHPFFQK